VNICVTPVCVKLWMCAKVDAEIYLWILEFGVKNKLVRVVI